jgi:phosphatidylglycerophosphatase A
MNQPTAKVNSQTPTWGWVFQKISRVLAFGFGSGLSPIAPGTIGTIWAWAAFLIGEKFLGSAQCWWMIGVGIILGCWICGQVSEELGKKDFGGIVWDEIVSFWLILLLISPSPIYWQLLAFALFRFFDAVKPGPIGTIDRHFKTLEGGGSNVPSSHHEIWWRGFGIVIDDLAAALFTLIVLALIQVAIKQFS